MSRFEVLALIEAFRAKLVELAQEKPLIDPEVVNLSQRLDSLLNYYQTVVA